MRETQAAVAPYAKRLRTVTGGEVLPGIHAVPLPGHTPGHTGFRVISGDETLLVWGDIIHFPAVQFAHPDAYMKFDVDPGQSKASRTRILGEAAREKYLVAGMHLDFPCFGHVAPAGNAYRWVPEPFTQI